MSSTLQFTQLAKLNLEKADATIVRPGGFRLARGLHKLLQQVVFFLSNTSGSVYGLPGVGSVRVAQIKGATLSDVSRVEQIIAGLQADIERWFISQPTTLPADERLATVQLTIGAIAEESITINVNITSVAGTAADYSYNLITTV